MKKRLREVIEKQLDLISEFQEKNISIEDVAVLSYAIAGIAKTIDCPIRFQRKQKMRVLTFKNGRPSYEDKYV